MDGQVLGICQNKGDGLVGGSVQEALDFVQVGSTDPPSKRPDERTWLKIVGDF